MALNFLFGAAVAWRSASGCQPYRNGPGNPASLLPWVSASRGGNRGENGMMWFGVVRKK
jgi:hypothetical protein